MAREKEPVHKVEMTEGKRNIIHQFFWKNMTSSLHLIFRMISKICLAHYKEDDGNENWMPLLAMKVRTLEL